MIFILTNYADEIILYSPIFVSDFFRSSKLRSLLAINFLEAPDGRDKLEFSQVERVSE